MAVAISPQLKDWDGAQTAVQNADPVQRPFFVEAGIVIAAGDWVTINIATNSFGLGNSISPLDTGEATTTMPVGVATVAAAPSAVPPSSNPPGEWILVTTRGVAQASLSNAGIGVGEVLIPSTTAGAADPSAAAAGEIQIGYCLEAAPTAAIVTCYVTCE